MSSYLKDLEDSRILFKTFCNGLMYGMFFYHGENLHRVTSIEGLGDTINRVYPIKECKPCLRSMPNLTEDELKDLLGYSGMREHEIEICKYDGGAELEFWLTEVPCKCISKVIDWLNAHHFDYHGLISKGLAIEAVEEMYNT